MAVGHIKRSVQTGAELPLQDALALERELQSLLFKSEDAKEGFAAYNEKRVACGSQATKNEAVTNSLP